MADAPWGSAPYFYAPQMNCQRLNCPACVDTLPGVRYALKFTLHDKLRLTGPDEAPHGRRQAPYTRTGFFRVVQPTRAESAARGLRAGAWMHDRASLRLGALGKYSTGAGSALQGHRSSKRGVSPVDSTQLH